MANRLAFLRRLRPSRKLFSSVFFKTTLLTAAVTAVVSLILMVSSMQMIERMVTKDLVASAESVTVAAAESLPNAIRYNVTPDIQKALDAALASAGEAGQAAAAFDKAGTLLLSAGTEDEALIAELQALSATAVETGEPVVAHEGMVQVVPVRKMANLPPMGTVAVMLSADAAMASMLQDKLVLLAQTGAVFVVLLIGFVVLNKRIIGTPIKSLSGSIEAIYEGNYDLKVAMVRRKDEFGGMALKVEALVEKLAAAREIEQEREIEARTQAEVVKHLTEGLNQLAQGDLSHGIEAEFPEEYEVLRQTFNSAIEGLRSAILQVQSGAQSILSGAEGIARGSDELSRRTETQAATLEESSAALDDLSNSVQSAASGAGEVDTVVKSTTTLAEANGAEMKRAIVAIGEVEKSSEKIGEIISLIDDIAFQTNLLALNAGVEAARAGSAGAGFAVVASEVRALAQRSSSAAAQIKTLIDGSHERVSEGVRLVESAGGALDQVVTKVKQISELMGNYAGVASEQSHGINEINAGVSSLDRVTQENAAMVHESNQASVRLQEEATKLTQLVAQFTIEASPAAYRMSA